MAYESGLEKRKSFIKFGREEKKEEKEAILLEEKAHVKAQDWSLQGRVRCSQWLQQGKYRTTRRMRTGKRKKPLGDG